ncbi:MAG: hypothetical protein H6741_08620 [Alphaproteobacteria bacterium]|nr:hypothetical protein [Alphaproteobacteria bacterium]MCB9792781.1 hypothetical protein [Alphaproteobacteria bacterium]
MLLALALLACGPKHPPLQEAATPLEQRVQADPSDLQAALDLADAYAAQGHHVFAILMAEHVALSTEDPAQRARAVARARDSLESNVIVSESRITTTLVPTRMAPADLSTLEDPTATWDRRYEVAVAVALAMRDQDLSQSGGPGADFSQLSELVRLRVTANRIALSNQKAHHTHPLVQYEAERDEAGCALALHAEVLADDPAELQAWLDEDPRAAETLKLCADRPTWTPPEGADLTRASWGVPW